MIKRFALAPLFGFCLFLTGSAVFASGEGKAVGVEPDAAARLNGQDRVLQVGTNVSVGELIVTGPSGRVQIIFDDDTRLVVGPRSQLLIETYLLASSNRAQKLTVDALGGTFRFITGNSPKPAYSINTPTASIAVRGTAFDLLVERSTTRVMLYEGALQLCNPNQACEVLTERCGVAVVSRQDNRIYRRNDPLREPLSTGFRYAQFQRDLLPDFRITGAGSCVETRSESVGSSGGGATQATPTAQPTPTLTAQPTPQPTAQPTPQQGGGQIRP